MYKSSADVCKISTKAKISKLESKSFRKLSSEEKIRSGDVIEDFSSGTRVVVGKDKFYGFLRGQRAGQAKLLPTVNDILRTL